MNAELRAPPGPIAYNVIAFGGAFDRQMYECSVTLTGGDDPAEALNFARRRLAENGYGAELVSRWLITRIGEMPPCRG